MNQSILDNVNTGFFGSEVIQKPQTSIKPSITINIPEVIPEPEPEPLEIKVDLVKPKVEESKSIELVVADKKDYIVPEYEITEIKENYLKEDSILDDINTGFGPENILSRFQYPTFPYFTHLYKETYLSEFVTETDKEKVRRNLGIYSLSETEKAIRNYTNSKFEEILNNLSTITNLDFVKSIADYSEVLNRLIRVLTWEDREFIPLTEARAVLVSDTNLAEVLDDINDRLVHLSEILANLEENYINNTTGIVAESIKYWDNGILKTVSFNYTLNFQDLYGT